MKQQWFTVAVDIPMTCRFKAIDSDHALRRVQSDLQQRAVALRQMAESLEEAARGATVKEARDAR